MMFVPSSYSHRYPREPHPFASQYPGAYTGDYGIVDTSALMDDLNSADETIRDVIPVIKKCISYIRKVKPKRGWGKSFRPRWQVWSLINKYVMPKLVGALRDLESAKAQLSQVKTAVSQLP